ncbi:hypothetical protein WJX72_007334 [[Myrmecia] bisecta]|uniref:Uncharacterized protein n=1 Tax=[Myrmecia] bisecta TaxID=41462 RepID=A0AAW1QRL7_9CHLO
MCDDILIVGQSLETTCSNMTVLKEAWSDPTRMASWMHVEEIALFRCHGLPLMRKGQLLVGLVRLALD